MLTNIEKFLAAVVAALVITTVNIGTNVSVKSLAAVVAAFVIIGSLVSSRSFRPIRPPNVIIPKPASLKINPIEKIEKKETLVSGLSVNPRFSKSSLTKTFSSPKALRMFVLERKTVPAQLMLLILQFEFEPVNPIPFSRRDFTEEIRNLKSYLSNYSTYSILGKVNLVRHWVLKKVSAKPLNQNVPAKPSNKVFFVNLYVYEEQKLINQRTNGQNVLINLYLSYLIQQFLIGIFWKSKALQSISQEFIDQNLGRVLNVTSYKPFKNWEIGLDGFPLRLYNESRQFFNSLFFDKGLDSNIFTLFRIYLEDKLASEPTAEQFIKCIPLQALNLALKENIDKLAHCEIMAEMAEVQAQAKDIRSIFQGVSASPTVDEASVVVSNLIQALDLKIGPRQMSTLLTKRLIQLKEKWGPAYGHKYLIEIEDQKAEGFESLENKRLERRKIEFKKQFLGSKSRSWIHKWACRKKKRIVEDLFTSTKRKNLAKDVHRWMDKCIRPSFLPEITIHSEVGDLEKKESPVLSLPVEDPWSLESCNGSVSSFPISIDN